MQGKRHESEPACGCGPADLSCAALTVRQLSQDRVRELAEEIWTRSTGGRLPASPVPDPRRSRPGASAFAAYRRYGQLEHQAWRPGWRWRAGMQRRSADVLAALEADGYLVLHDVTLPGWPASLDHLVVGSTRVWVIMSWRPSWPAALRKSLSPKRAQDGSAGMVRGLRGEAEAVADALASAGNLPVRALLCAHGWAWPTAGRSVHEVQVATPRRLAAAIRSRPPVQRGEVDRAAARALEVLRPAV
jgi:nuclease-like protein